MKRSKKHKCKNKDCTNCGNVKYRYYCTHCFANLFPKDPLVFQIRIKSKENYVRDFLNEIDIYALISGIDMAPLTLLEAQLMQKPVIATNVGGIPELIINNKTGILVPPNDPEKLADAINDLLVDKVKSEKLKLNANIFVKNNIR